MNSVKVGSPKAVDGQFGLTIDWVIAFTDDDLFAGSGFLDPSNFARSYRARLSCPAEDFRAVQSYKVLGDLGAGA